MTKADGAIYLCGECMRSRGNKRFYASFADLSRHASQAHPDLDYVPAKRVVGR